MKGYLVGICCYIYMSHSYLYLLHLYFYICSALLCFKSTAWCVLPLFISGLVFNFTPFKFWSDLKPFMDFKWHKQQWQNWLFSLLLGQKEIGVLCWSISAFPFWLPAYFNKHFSGPDFEKSRSLLFCQTLSNLTCGLTYCSLDMSMQNWLAGC